MTAAPIRKFCRTCRTLVRAEALDDDRRCPSCRVQPPLPVGDPR